MTRPNAKFRSQLWALATIVLLCLAFACVTSGAERRVTVAPGLIELRLAKADGADVCQWQPLSPFALQYRTYEGGGVLVTYATAGELVITSYLVDFDDKRFESDTWIVTVGDGPQPPGPDPQRPAGFAGEVYDQVRAVGQPEVARKYALALEAVVPLIGTQLNDLPAIHARVKAASTGIAVGDPKWQAFGNWLRGRLNTLIVDVPSAAKTFTDVAAGLRAGGGS